MIAQRSELSLEIRLPASARDPIEFQTSTGMVWSRNAPVLPGNLRADVLWERLVEDWPNRWTLLHDSGAALGAWLFDQRAADYLAEQASGWSVALPRRRVELRMPRELADWPWEMIVVEGLAPLSVHQAFTLTRVSDKGEQPQAPVISQLGIEVVGVQLDEEEEEDWIELATGMEIERVRVEIEAIGSRGRFSVKVDPLGEWAALVRRYESQGPPHVFHFAGHGLDQGRGLVFRGETGLAEEIPADLIASLLSRRRQGKQARLAYLNACATAAAGRGPFQPFGGLAQMLIQHNIPAVVGFQTPVEDHLAQKLAIAFYGAVARGDSIDCALQAAREALYYTGALSTAWAFASLTVSGAPHPLWLPLDVEAAHQSSADIRDFGHEPQRHRLERFLKRQSPLVVVIHGEARSGHRHVALRVQHDLEKVGNVLWRPVATMRWFVAGEPRLSRSQLAGGIARALSIPDVGTQEHLEESIAREIAERCAEGRAVVIDLEEVLSLRDETQADALVTLVQGLWSDLMDAAVRYQPKLPVFLILSIAYPPSVPVRHPWAKLVRRQTMLTEKTIETLARESRLKGKVRVEVLPKLEPIEVSYVSRFLEEVLDLEPSRADGIAFDLVGVDDNDTILQRMSNLLIEWGSS